MPHVLPWKRILGGMLLALGMLWTPVLAEENPDTNVIVQVMLGAARYSSMNLADQSTTDPSVETESEITWMPTIGIYGGVPLTHKAITFGLEGGALVAWKSDTVTAYGGSGNGIRVHTKNELYLVDLSGGPYLSTPLGQHARFYIGAGPLLMYGQNNMHSDEYQDDTPTVSDHDTSSAYGGGVYARTGIELKLGDGYWMGLGIRAFSSRLDFDTAADKTDVKGAQLLITYTFGI